MNVDFARQQMIEQQVRAWDVFERRVLDVLGAVPRENFVPEAYQSLAFADTEIPIGHGQTMMTPTVEGRLLQALDIGGDDDVLEIGTGSGFLTACLARLAATVTSVDIFDDLVESAQERLDESGVGNVELASLDATRELPDRKFAAIAVTGSIEVFDPRYVMALEPGGRLFVVIGAAPVMEARLVVRTGETDWQSRSLFETSLTPLIHGRQPPRFLF